MKATCLWLVGLPLLKHTKVVGPPPIDKNEKKSWEKCFRAGPSEHRQRDRSETKQGIADAIAEQYGPYFRGE